MKIQKEFYVYTLTDGQGDSRLVVVDDCSDNMTIGGYTADGQYHQFDSYEAYHAYGWAQERGFKLTSETRRIEVDVPDPWQYCWKCDHTHAVDGPCPKEA